MRIADARQAAAGCEHEPTLVDMLYHLQEEMAAAGVGLSLELRKFCVRESFTEALQQLIERLAALRCAVGSSQPLRPAALYVINDYCASQRRWGEDADTLNAPVHDFANRTDDLIAVRRYADPPGTRYVGVTRKDVRVSTKRAMIDHVAFLAARLREPSNLTSSAPEQRRQAAREAARILAAVDDLEQRHGLRRFVPEKAQLRVAVHAPEQTGRNEDLLQSLDAETAQLNEWRDADEHFFEEVQHLVDDVHYSANRTLNLAVVVEKRNEIERYLDDLVTLMNTDPDVQEALGEDRTVDVLSAVINARGWMDENEAVTLESLTTLEREIRTLAADAGLAPVAPVSALAAQSQNAIRADGTPAHSTEDRELNATVDVACALVEELHFMRAAAAARPQVRQRVGDVVTAFEKYVDRYVFEVASGDLSSDARRPAPLRDVLAKYEDALTTCKRLGVQVPASCWARVPERSVQ